MIGTTSTLPLSLTASYSSVILYYLPASANSLIFVTSLSDMVTWSHLTTWLDQGLIAASPTVKHDHTDGDPRPRGGGFEIATWRKSETSRCVPTLVVA